MLKVRKLGDDAWCFYTLNKSLVNLNVLFLPPESLLGISLMPVSGTKVPGLDSLGFI